MRSIILIGMPSCGKSTLGVLLAKRLGMRFLDSDLLIQEQEGMLLHQIINERGISGFLAVENRVNSSICDDNTVVSTGGSVIYGKEAMEHLSALGTVVYLRIPFETMKERLGDYTHRGVVMPNGGTLEEMYRERAPLYERYAHLAVDVCDFSLSDSVERICSALER